MAFESSHIVLLDVGQGAKTVVSGEKALLRVSGYEGIEVLTTRSFVDKHLM